MEGDVAAVGDGVATLDQLPSGMLIWASLPSHRMPAMAVG